MVVVLLGPPGVGKGTQAVRLVDELSAAHVSTGDLLRAARRDGTELGKIAQGFMDRGELVPDELILDMVKEHLAGIDASTEVMFDGFPRTIPQAEALSQLTDISHVLAIEVPDDRIVERICGRLTCGTCGHVYHDTFNPVPTEGCTCGNFVEKRRADDTEETVLNRLGAYHDQTSPLADWYEARGLFHRVDGDREINAVTEALLNIVQ